MAGCAACILIPTAARYGIDFLSNVPDFTLTFKLPTMRILIIEDEAPLLERVTAQLREQGYAVDSAAAVSYTHLDVYKRQYVSCAPYPKH